jgi:hypothetical protein
VTLACLKGKDAESEEAQEHANSSSLAFYITPENSITGDFWLTPRTPVIMCPCLLIGRHVVCLMGGRLLSQGIQFRRIQRLFRAARDGQLQHGRCQQIC